MKIIWIGNTSVGRSETFISRTLDDLTQFGEVSAICGADSFESNPEVQLLALGFANPREFLWERIARKLMKKNFYFRRIDRSFSKRFHKKIRDTDDVVLFIEFGNSAALIANSLVQLNKKYVVTVHGMDVSAMLRIEEYTTRLCHAANHKNCLGVLCASHHTKRLCILAGIGSDKCIVSRLPLDSARLKKVLSISKTEYPSFVHLGRLTGKKHPLATLEAFRIVRENLPSSRLTFIGDGELRDELEVRIKALGLSESVEILGAMSHDRALEKMQKHWVFVQHSVTSELGDQEGFALSPAEAALMEMPVISTMHNGIPEHVIDGKTGFLVREFDYESMAERMLLLVSDPELMRAFGRAGRENIQKICNPGNRLRELKRLFQNPMN